MRKLSTLAAAFGLAVLGVAVPTASAHASAQTANCNGAWPGRNGNMYAWDNTDCSGPLLGFAAGNDFDWGDGSGPFGNANDRASSVMNAGFIGGGDVVAFYFFTGATGALRLPRPGELYADDLSDNTFTNGQIVDNNIRSHYWVETCAAGTWIG